MTEILAVDSLLHKLWTKAVGTKDYNKTEWLELEKGIWGLAKVIDNMIDKKAPEQKKDKKAWSDFKDHVLIGVGGTESGMDTKIAKDLYYQLGEAIIKSI